MAKEASLTAANFGSLMLLGPPVPLEFACYLRPTEVEEVEKD